MNSQTPVANTNSPVVGASTGAISKTCQRCGSTDIVTEAAVRWSEANQQWEISCIYDDSASCDQCDGDTRISDTMLEAPVPRTFTVFVQQADGRGTTNVTALRATDSDQAIALALSATTEDWGMTDASNLRVLGVAEGDVEILSWDDIGG